MGAGFFFSLFFFPDGGILGLAFGVLSAGHGGIMVFFSFRFFFRHRFGGVRRRRVEEYGA